MEPYQCAHHRGHVELDRTGRLWGLGRLTLEGYSSRVLVSTFWDVISVGFMVWFPLMFLEMGLTDANPVPTTHHSRPMFFLIFVLLNPCSRSDLPKPSRDRHFEMSCGRVMNLSWKIGLNGFYRLRLRFAPFGLYLLSFKFPARPGRRGGLDFLGIFITLPVYQFLSEWLSLLGLSFGT